MGDFNHPWIDLSWNFALNSPRWPSVCTLPLALSGLRLACLPRNLYPNRLPFRLVTVRVGNSLDCLLLPLLVPVTCCLPEARFFSRSGPKFEQIAWTRPVEKGIQGVLEVDSIQRKPNNMSWYLFCPFPQ